MSFSLVFCTLTVNIMLYTLSVTTLSKVIFKIWIQPISRLETNALIPLFKHDLNIFVSPVAKNTKVCIKHFFVHLRNWSIYIQSILEFLQLIIDFIASRNIFIPSTCIFPATSNREVLPLLSGAIKGLCFSSTAEDKKGDSIPA